MKTREFGVVERMIHAATRAKPRAAQAAISSLSRLLDGMGRSCRPEVAWSFSHLTGTGVPIEFSWSPVERAVRYTSEIAGPEADPIERLEQARHLLGELSCHSLPDDLLRQLRDLQSLGPLHYGAWVGGRHTDRGDDYKLYTEAPEGNPGLTAHFLRQQFGERAFLASRPVRFRLVGYPLGSARLEFYFQVGELHAWELGRLLDRCGLYHRLPDLLSLVKTVYGCQIRERLPGSNFGFSFARLPGQETGLFSLFT